MSPAISSFVGVSFTVKKPDLFFARDFTVIEEELQYFRIKNQFETYLVSKDRFQRGLSSKAFVQQDKAP